MWLFHSGCQLRRGSAGSNRWVPVHETVAVLGKVGRDPVEDHPQPALVEMIHEEREVLGIPVSRRGREVPGALVPPGAVEGMLGDREDLHVGEALLQDVVRETWRDLPVGR